MFHNRRRLKMWGYGNRQTYHSETARNLESGARTKSVFDNRMVAHVWAQQTQSFGRSNNGNFYFNGPTIYSYGSHFPIATFLDLMVGGKQVVLFTEDKYSVSTSGHINDVRGALRGLTNVLVIDVPKLSLGYSGQFSPTPEVLDSIRQSFIVKLDRAQTDVEHYSEYQDSPHYVHWTSEAKAKLVSLREDYKLFAKVFKYLKRLPDNAGEVLAKQASDKKAKEFKDKVDSAIEKAKLVPRVLEALKADFTELPALGTLGDYQIQDRVRQLTNQLATFNRAKFWLGRGKAGKVHKNAIARGIKQVSTTLDAWKAYADLSRREGEKAAAITLAKCLFDEMHGKLDPKMSYLCERYRVNSRNAHYNLVGQIGFRDGQWNNMGHGLLEQTINEFMRYGADVIPHLDELIVELTSRISAIVGQREFPREQKPVWYYNKSADGRTQTERREDWLAGEQTRFHQETPTLVRKAGEMLETSRGASAPFTEAVTIYRAAARCKASGTSWHRNGQRMHVGHFELESIDASGNIRVGCHRIGFDEMERLAVREVPELVRARFPLPVVQS